MSHLICHIIAEDTWQTVQTQSSYHHCSLVTEGFIHCSSPEQVVKTAERFFAGQTGLLLLWIRRDRLTAKLQDDLVPGHGTFPHLYGPLNLDAVVQVDSLTTNAQGQFQLPPIPEP